jgi:hypothetical protein
MNAGFYLNAAAAGLNFCFYASSGSLTNLFCGIASAIVAAWCFET